MEEQDNRNGKNKYIWYIMIIPSLIFTIGVQVGNYISEINSTTPSKIYIDPLFILFFTQVIIIIIGMIIIYKQT